MWTDDNRATYERKGARYPSDLTDEEWALVEPHLPPPRKPRGTKAREKKPVDRREVLNGVLYVLTTGCQWRQLPKDLPPKSTVHEYLMDWRSTGVLAKLHYALYVEACELAGRNPGPSLAIVDSQSVNSVVLKARVFDTTKGGPTSIRLATMAARRSKAKSATLPSIRKAS